VRFLTITNIARVINNTDFITLLLLIGLLILVLAKVIFQDFFGKAFQLKNENFENQYLISGFLTLVLLINFTILIIPFVKNITSSLYFTNIYIKYIAVFILLSVFYLIKNLFFYLYHVILTNQESYTEFVQLRITNTSWLIIYSFLMILYYFYSSFEKKYFTEIIIILYLFIKIIEWIIYIIQNKTEKQLQWYYKIVYLCTLEILPLVVIFKFLFIK